MSSNTSNVVFEYTGKGERQQFPEDLVRVRFHPSVKEADDRAFWGYKRLREVVLNEGLNKISKMAFAACQSLESITIPSTVTDIGVEAFCNCGNLREVILNEGLVKIGRCSFAMCKVLQSIAFPSTVTDIGNSAFVNCSSLREVVLNEGLVKIGRSAFSECTSLQRITLPSAVEEIGDYGFNVCVNLRELVLCSERLPMIEPSTFDRCHALERITFPNISSRLEAIIRAGQVGVQNKLQQYINRGDIEWRRGYTISIPVEVTRRSRTGWGLVQQYYRQIVNWVRYYEMKEATTLFELALWKAKIDQVGGINRHDRDAYRVDVPGPVKDTILQYLL